MGWDFAGKWLSKRVNKPEYMDKELWNQLCEEDRKKIIKRAKENTIVVGTLFFWLFVTIIFVIALVVIL